MNLVFFLEEPSAREMLKGLLPRVLPCLASIRYIVFEGKQDLKKNLTRRLRGWHSPNSIFVVMCDQDASCCSALKSELTKKCQCFIRAGCAGKRHGRLQLFHDVFNPYHASANDLGVDPA